MTTLQVLPADLRQLLQRSFPRERTSSVFSCSLAPPPEPHFPLLRIGQVFRSQHCRTCMASGKSPHGMDRTSTSGSLQQQHARPFRVVRVVPSIASAASTLSTSSLLITYEGHPARSSQRFTSPGARDGGPTLAERVAKRQGRRLDRVSGQCESSNMSFVRNQEFPCKQSVRGELVVSVLRNSDPTLGNQRPNAVECTTHKSCRTKPALRAARVFGVRLTARFGEFRVTCNFNI